MKNVYMHKFMVLIALIILVSSIAAGCAPGEQSSQPTQQAIDPKEAQQIAYDATVYGFPLVIMDLTRQAFTAVPAPTENGAPVGQFSNKRAFPDATFTTVVRPNADTLYSTAWIDTAKEPVILSVPDSNGRYYMISLQDYWTDVFASLGSRTSGTGAGNFAITGPKWSGELPEGVTEVKSPTRWVWIIGRFACSGSSDYDNVHKLQDQMKLTPLSAWGAGYTPPASVAVDPNVSRKVSPLDQLLAMDAPTYINYFCRVMVENPPYAADAPFLDKAAGIGIKPGADYQAYFAGLDDDVKSAIQAGYQSALAKIPMTGPGDEKNGWRMVYGAGDYGTDYMLRAIIDYQGLGANLDDDAFYPSLYRNTDGEWLSSDNKYVLHFDKDVIPPANGFWSLSMYNDKILFAANPINRYNLGSMSDPPLITNPDGSIDIYIQRDSPDPAGTPNWLPAPAGGNFSLTLRLYWPKESVVDKSWAPPAIQLVGQSTQPAQQAIDPKEAQQIAYDAAVYGFPPVIMDLTRQVFTAVPEPMENGAPVNQFGNKKEFPDATFTAVVRPNADTLYSAAWVDTACEPFILSVPDTQGRYYMLPLMNYWTDVFESPGSRTTGTGAGNFVITGPGWGGKLPEGVTEIKSPGRWVWIIGRIACSGSADYDNVHKIQDQMKLTPLSKWGTDYEPQASVPVDPNVNRKISPLDQLLAMDASAYFNNVCRLMVENPPYETDAPILARMAEIGVKPGADYRAYFAGLDDDVKAAIQDGYQSALKDMPQTKLGNIKNNWQMVYDTGDYGTNYMFRAAVDYQGLGANLNADAFYESSFMDGDGQRFSSDKKCVLHFDKDQIPPINGFWSLTLYNDKMAFADNPINRYSLGSLSNPPLIKNSDGSLDIYIQRDAPDPATPNWLPAPAGGNFSLTLRLYWPKDIVVDKEWAAPAVQPVK